MTGTTSQNGWPSSTDRNAIAVKNFVIDGANQHFAMAAGAAPVLGAFAAEFNKLVVPINPPAAVFDDWGYGCGDSRGIAAMESNHASGTALDINATKHIQGGVVSGYTPPQEKVITSLCTKYGIRWGFTYHQNKDPMHFEIVESPATVAARIKTMKLPMPEVLS